MAHPLSKARDVARRLVISGSLVLQSPTNLGNGDGNDLTDMPLLLDPVSGRALLPGTSVAGALRAYLRRLAGGLAAQGRHTEQEMFLAACERLFGAEKSSADGPQSAIIIDDALADRMQIDLRDGVSIDPARRTAKAQAKYDLELLEPGTTFDLRLELLLPQQDDPDLRQALAWALDGLGAGHIRLGVRKQRGFGECAVTGWSLTEYNLLQRDGLMAWLAQGNQIEREPLPPRRAATAGALLDVAAAAPSLEEFRLTAHFAVESSLLIRSGFGEQDSGPDAVHLHARSPKDLSKRRPVLSGTSVAGAMRARARRILRTLTLDPARPGEPARQARVAAMVDTIFGPQKIGGKGEAYASRLRVDETPIEHGLELVQNRIRVDRFTGGAYDSALFNVMPVFGQEGTVATIRLALRFQAGAALSAQAQIGLLLLVIKDLWTGRLTLGGESSVGRGRLRGLDAEIQYRSGHWHMRQMTDGSIAVEPERESLEAFVTALHKELNP